jgi:GH15 family glucan-1,4-alpha-glucosidase
MDRYPSIGEYAYIADCHSAALVSRAGSIDWCCMPRMDSPSCFGRLLDWEKGGYFQVVPAARWTCTRRYLGRSLILETTFRTETGEVRLTDFFPMREGGEYQPYLQILRLIAGLAGEVPLAIDIVPRFDYGAIRPWIRETGPGQFVAVGGADGLVFSSDAPLRMRDRHRLGAQVAVKEGQRLCISTLYRLPELLDGTVEVPELEVLARRQEETADWWRRWGGNLQARGPYADQAACSAVVLKGLTNAPTGAVAAAPTTSLPESPGGSRNWDYRYSWIRDSCFSVRALAEVGLHREADGFRRFIERSAAGGAEELQIVFGLGGERRLYEYEISELEGYGGARPVRVGNGAVSQLQLDVYGELLDLAWIWHQWGQSPDRDYWEFLVQIVELAGRIWEQPDRGIWEIRGEPRHFVYSKAMCWVALDRGIRLAEEIGREAPVERWRELRSRIRAAVDGQGYDRERGVYVQAFGSRAMDAALLLLPIFGYVAFDDERMVRTTDAVRRELDDGGLLRRYGGESDGLEGREGVFLACTFWLAACLAHQGRHGEAESVFERALSTGNDLGLFAEEYDPRGRQLLGNFPQGLTHLSLILAATALSEREAGWKRKLHPAGRRRNSGR